MQIIFVLDQDTDTDEIERELRQISGISWVLGSNNLAIHVHEKLLESTEERILDSVARGVFPRPQRISLTTEYPESTALCGALPINLDPTINTILDKERKIIEAAGYEWDETIPGWRVPDGHVWDDVRKKWVHA